MELFQFLEKNLEALTRRNAPIVEWLHGRNIDLKGLENQLVVNAFGQVDLPMQGEITMFGSMPPAPYYRDWKPMPHAERCGTVIVGCNLGYGLNHILSTFPRGHVVGVIEPRGENLACCLGMTDYSPYINNGTLEFIVPDRDGLFQYLGRQDLRFLHGSIQFRGDTPSRQLGPEYARLSQMAQNTMEDVAVELTTLRRMQDTMVGNEIHNFRRAFRHGSISPLENSAKGATAVILGAGPSFNEFGPQIASMCDNALVATAMQTLPTVQAAGIKPDLCMAIDYSDGIVRAFDKLDHEWAKDIPFIYSTKVGPEVVRRYPGPKIPFWTLGGLATFLMRDLEPVMDAGGNVSVALMRVLEWCGASRFVLVGQDFAWQGDRSHAGGHHASFKRKFDPRRHVRLKNMHGEEIISAQSYMTAQRDMQLDVQRMELPTYNLYGGGLEIKGSEVVTLLDLKERGLLESDPKAVSRFGACMVQAASPKSVPVFEPRSDQWSASLRSVQKRLTKLYKKAVSKQDEIHKSLEQVLMFLRQDPLYTPYLYNEFIDVAAMVNLPGRHDMKQFTNLKKIFRRVLEKVKEIDGALAGNTEERAA